MQRQVLEDLIKDAMRARDKVRLSILRQVKEELKKIEVDERREPSEQDIDHAIKKLLKITNETLDGSIKAGTNEERTAQLQEQVEILQSIMPKQLEGSELESLVDKVLEEMNTTSKKDMGKIMGEISQQTGGNFDKPAAAKYLSSKLS
ncbi:MAG: GatB/YqeY domain-containing protein [Coriobacteriia bacterium]|nr:GatB/YqeY domain-containing protein [Coriobacteriia bacterium]